MLGGYMGKFLRVNLTERKIKVERFDEKVLRKYIGGSGLGVKILYEETKADVDPLEPASPLMFITGPVTGTPVYFSGRHTIIAKSPLSGIFGEASVGGYWGSMLKRSGYDGIIVTGKSPKPVYIWINEEKVAIKDAAHLWGKDTYEVDLLIKKEIGKDTVVTSIGQAGEKLAKISCIMTDGKAGRAAARCGLGVVMGSKKLKAIAVKGSNQPPIAHKSQLIKSTKKFNTVLKKNPIAKWVAKHGTAGAVLGIHEKGGMPIKNWQLGSWEEGAKKIAGEAMTRTILTGKYHCAHCPVAGGRKVKITEGPFAPVDGAGPEYETLGLMGGSCLVDNLEAIAKANELCNRYGIDTIETGNIIAFAMEAYERGLITREDTGGLALTWGSPYALVELVNQIGTGTGIGKLLGQGLRRAAEQIGGESSEFIIHAKGVAFPAHDPRATFGSAVEFATSPIGASHCQAAAHDFEDGRPIPPEFNLPKQDRFSVEGEGILVSKLNDLMTMFNALCQCIIVTSVGATITDLASWLSYVTGWDVDAQEFLETGKRIFNLKRVYNNRLGISRKDDILPSRVLTLAAKDGGRAGKLPPLNLMLKEYYEHRGWDEFGRPLPETLAKLALEKNKTLK